jgi:hypothetical protein
MGALSLDEPALSAERVRELKSESASIFGRPAVRPNRYPRQQRRSSSPGNGRATDNPADLPLRGQRPLRCYRCGIPFADDGRMNVPAHLEMPVASSEMRLRGWDGCEPSDYGGSGSQVGQDKPAARHDDHCGEHHPHRLLTDWHPARADPDLDRREAHGIPNRRLRTSATVSEMRESHFSNGDYNSGPSIVRIDSENVGHLHAGPQARASSSFFASTRSGVVKPSLYVP